MWIVVLSFFRNAENVDTDKYLGIQYMYAGESTTVFRS